MTPKEECETLLDRFLPLVEQHLVKRGGFLPVSAVLDAEGQAGLNCRIVPVTSAEYQTAAKRPAYSVLDTSKITRDFGIVPRPWIQALRACIHEMKNEK